MAIMIKTPEDCSQGEFDSFIRLARDGGQVEGQRLPARVKRARALAFLLESGEIIGIAALKRPYDGYRADVFTKACSTVSPASFTYEVGWVVIAEAHRGRKLSLLLVEAVLTKSEGGDLFATSAITRTAMHRTLNHFGFVQHGHAYPPSESEDDLLLFIRTDAQPSAAPDRQQRRCACCCRPVS